MVKFLFGVTVKLPFDGLLTKDPGTKLPILASTLTTKLPEWHFQKGAAISERDTMENIILAISFYATLPLHGTRGILGYVQAAQQYKTLLYRMDLS